MYASVLTSLPDTVVVAGCCRTESEGQAFAEKFSATWYDNYATMIEKEKAHPDGLAFCVVCTPSGAHMEPVLACAARGVHVICDKPLEIALDRCDRMIQACADAGVLLGGIFQSRFMPAMTRLKAAVDAGRFGPEGRLATLCGVVPWWREDAYYSKTRWQGTKALDGGGAVINQTIHTIEYVLGCISNTASYLRLWALSLAHTQLAELFMDMILTERGLKANESISHEIMGLPEGSTASLVVHMLMLFLTYGMWVMVTLVVLMVMENLSSFLHALRLQWVEFQNKFFYGDGQRYAPFTFKHIGAAVAAEED